MCILLLTFRGIEDILAGFVKRGAGAEPALSLKTRSNCTTYACFLRDFQVLRLSTRPRPSSPTLSHSQGNRTLRTEPPDKVHKETHRHTQTLTPPRYEGLTLCRCLTGSAPKNCGNVSCPTLQVLNISEDETNNCVLYKKANRRCVR